jgi:Ca2+-binding RTX toxin-like protein
LKKLVVVIAALSALLMVSGAVAATGEGTAPEQGEAIVAPSCHGRKATIVGSDGPDVLHGTPSRDVIWGGKGDDTIYGSLGNDLICGAAGNDLIHGGRGNDDVDGGAGEDRVYGDLGDDKVLGGAGARDEVSGGLGIDIANGGPGDEDVVHGDYGWDRMSGGAGKADLASFATAIAGGRGSGVWASLRTHRAFGDGHDKLFEFEGLEGSAFRDTLIGSRQSNLIEGGAGDDHLVGGGGQDSLDGGQGDDACKGAKGRTASCGKEAAPKGSAYVQLDRRAAGGAGLQLLGGAGADHFDVSFDEAGEVFEVSARKPLALGPGCLHPPHQAKLATCASEGPARWLMADLGPGNDSFTAKGSLKAVGFVRVGGGFGNDTIHGGPEDDLLQAGPGADKVYGGAGADGLVGSLPGPTYLYGGPGGDLLAAGGGCAGGGLVGGPGRDDASFAETQAHPGLLIISFPLRSAWITTIPSCHHVYLSPSDEDMEGSFDNDVLIGDAGPNSMLGQPGEDVFVGNGGEDVIDARDGVRDESIQCGRGHPAERKKHGKGLTKPTGTPEGRALTDPFDPPPFNCAITVHGTPVPGLHPGRHGAEARN